jgi:HK97 family phage major capsid protein
VDRNLKELTRSVTAVGDLKRTFRRRPSVNKARLLFMKKKQIETPTALPKLVRYMPVELLAIRKGKAKVQIATAADLAERISSLNIELPDAARTWRGLVKAAKRLNITIDDPKTAELKAWRAAAEAEPDPDDLDEDEEDESERTFEMSFSSEAPVPRWFGNEILEHSADALDLTRASSGLAYLVDHDTGDQVGIIRNFRIDGKKTRGDVTFSRSQRGQDIQRDVEDGIRPFTSIGYRVIEMVLEKESEEGNDYRVTRWQPMEGSTVAVPADYTVGAGRSAGSEEFPIQVRSADVKNPAPAPPAQIEVRTMNPKQVSEIFRLCIVHGVKQERATEIVEMEGMTSDRASALILEEVAKKGGAPVITPGAERTGDMLELTEREQKQYNLCRGIMTHVRNIEQKSSDKSFETEVSDELAKKHEGKYRGGLLVPFKLSIDPSLVRAAVEILKRTGVSTALTAGTATKGSELVFTEPGPFIKFLYNRMRLKELGAETISGLQGNIAFPKQTGKASGSWVAENPGTDVADSNATLSQVTMSPKTYQSSTAYSRQLLAQAVIDVDNLVRNDLATDVALAIDAAGISGTAAPSPVGILSTSGVQNFTLKNDSGNGSVVVWDDITGMEALIEDVNADQVGDPAWLTTPGVKALLKRTPQLVYTPPGASTTVNVTGNPIWEKGDEIDGRMARQSNQVPSTLTKGTSAGDVHALIYGVFSTLVNGMWGSGFELIVDPYRLKKQGLIELTTFVLTDWANRYPVAFAVAKDVTLT